MSPRRKHFAFCVLAGLSFTSAQAPLGIWPGVMLGFALSVWLLRISETPLRAFWTGWSIGASYFATSLIWIVEPFLVDFAATAWMAPFALVLMASGLALFWAMPFWGAAKLGKPVTILALWPLAEYARSVLFSGFPWGLSAYAWVDTPVAQIAAWTRCAHFGACGFTRFHRATPWKRAGTCGLAWFSRLGVDASWRHAATGR